MKKLEYRERVYSDRLGNKSSNKTYNFLMFVRKCLYSRFYNPYKNLIINVYSDYGFKKGFDNGLSYNTAPFLKLRRVGRVCGLIAYYGYRTGLDNRYKCWVLLKKDIGKRVSDITKVVVRV